MPQILVKTRAAPRVRGYGRAMVVLSRMRWLSPSPQSGSRSTPRNVASLVLVSAPTSWNMGQTGRSQS
jgi:hypothetical protein